MPSYQLKKYQYQKKKKKKRKMNHKNWNPV